MTSIVTWFKWPKGDGNASQPGPVLPSSPDNPPGSGPRPDGGRRPVSEQPKPGSVDDVGACLEALHAAEDALAAERAAQAKRVAALGQCEQGLAQERARDIADIQRAIDDAMKRFEELQQRLKQEVGNQLNQIAKFNDDYNKAWNKGMDGIDKYLHTYLQLLPGLKNLFDLFVDRNTALEMGHAIDEKIHQAVGAVMAVEGAAGLVRGVAKWVMEDAALEAGEAAAGLASKEGLAGIEGEATLAREGAKRGVLEGTSEAAGKEAVTEGAEGGKGVVQKTEGEGFETVKGGGEGRPPEWETQKLGPDGKPVEPEGKLPGPKDETTDIPAEKPVDPKGETAGYSQEEIERQQQAAQRARIKELEKQWDEEAKTPRIERIKAETGETTEEVIARLNREKSLAGTPFDPGVAETNMKAAQHQLENLANGDWKSLGLKEPPSVQQVNKIVNQYQDAVETMKQGQQLGGDFWSRMPREQAEFLKQQVDSFGAGTREQWLEKIIGKDWIKKV